MFCFIAFFKASQCLLGKPVSTPSSSPYELGSVNHLSLKFQQRRKAQPTAPLSLFTLASMMKSFLNLSRLGISFWGLFSFSFWVLKKKEQKKKRERRKTFHPHMVSTIWAALATFHRLSSVYWDNSPQQRQARSLHLYKCYDKITNTCAALELLFILQKTPIDRGLRQ